MAEAADELIRSYFRRWSSIEDDKAALAEDSKELFKEAKAMGIDAKALREAFRVERAEANRTTDMDEHEALVDLYRAALSGTVDAPVRTQARDAREQAAPAATNTTPGPTPLRPATGGQGTHADAARPTGGGPDMLGQASEAGQEAGGAQTALVPPAPQRTLSEIAGGYRPAPIRKAPVTDDDLGNDPWLGMRFGEGARP
jgi:uncharacterized protein (UPF0335 family)